ncbi:protein kinase superfamily protein [Abortiporus biennis]
MVNLSAILLNQTGYVLRYGGARLRLTEILGTGAYGIVYLAHDLNSPPHNPKFFAVKCLLRHAKGSRYDISQHREILLHRSLSHHPNIVTLHNVVAREHYIYLVMDYCPGGDLFSAIMDRGVYDNNNDAVKRSMLQLIDALEECHSYKIFHRDIKPENILCSADGSQVYLSDFGLASQCQMSTTFGCGSSYYMSPECVGVITNKLPYSTRTSDVWSLGIVLSNMLTGRNPWHIASPQDDRGFASFLQQGAPFLLSVLPISRSAARLLSRTFDPDPETRITLPELRKAIQGIQSFFPSPEISAFTPIADADNQGCLVRPATYEQDTVVVEAILRPLTVPPYHHRVHPSPSTVPAGLMTPTAEIVLSAFANEKPMSSVDTGIPPPPLTTPDMDISMGSSSGDSVGPITPATRTRDPAVSLPDDAMITSECGAVNVVVLDFHLPKRPKPVAGHHPLLPKTVQRFVGLLQSLTVGQ